MPLDDIEYRVIIEHPESGHRMPRNAPNRDRLDAQVAKAERRGMRIVTVQGRQVGPWRTINDLDNAGRTDETTDTLGATSDHFRRNPNRQPGKRAA
jgi:hypothetical protein